MIPQAKGGRSLGPTQVLLVLIAKRPEEIFTSVDPNEISLLWYLFYQCEITFIGIVHDYKHGNFSRSSCLVRMRLAS